MLLGATITIPGLWILSMTATMGYVCHGMVPTLLIAPLDLGKEPFRIAMAIGISIVTLVALATSLSTSSGCYLA
jgi:hypothetical protein